MGRKAQLVRIAKGILRVIGGATTISLEYIVSGVTEDRGNVQELV